MLPDFAGTAVQAQLYYDPNSTYFFTLDYKKCAKYQILTTLALGPFALCSPCGDTILLFPLNQFILAMKLPLLLVLGRYFVYDSEVQLLCLVDSQVDL